jgi:glycosyltransferase involved in cell wall biosynthesis
VNREIAAVVIGRNEGDRLAECLQSVAVAGLHAIYVDSGSTDDSLAIAADLKVPSVALEPGRPFSAARGRNAGLEEVRRRWPQAEFVQFLDGDCILDPDFPVAAVAHFGGDSRCAIVTGHLSERYPEASIYNRLCAIEWRSPAGPIENMNALGGIMAARISALVEVGGFNEQAIAGEEPDLGVRLGLAGHSIFKLDRPMATHDAQILRFGQWWKRAVRAGHALAHRYARHGRSRFRDGRREIRSVLFWAFLLPLAALALLWSTRGLSLLLLAGYAVLAWRVHRYYVRTGVPDRDARLAARFIVYGKFAEFVGILRYGLNRLRGRFHIIEYK